MRIAEIIARLGGACEGDASVEVTGAGGAHDAGSGDITFALDERALATAESGRASCVIVPRNLRASPTTLIRCDAPQRYMADVMCLLCPEAPPAPGVHPSAVIGDGPRVDESASIGPHVTIGSGCEIGAAAVLMASVVIGDGCVVGSESVIHPNVTVYRGTRIGARVTIHAGAVIGADGFGYFPDEGGLHKWPHVGNVVIEDDAEIGSNACIDRAKFGTTLIERGAKIDNLVQIAHNCRVGPWAILAGQTGLSGSVTIEAGAVCAGQVGIADHNTIGRGARIGAQSGIIKDVPPGAEMFGYPAQPVRKNLQEVAMLRYLAENRAVLRKLIRRAENP